MASLLLKNIYKVYSSNVVAVSDFNLEIEDKEFVVFVGPSGCGKSTALRMIAGLEDISQGELYIDGELVNNLAPKDRDIAMVFQNYALYPHFTVYNNMAYGLRIRKMSNDEIDKRVRKAAEILKIDKYLTRHPKELSGGQRQRVALGRAMVRYPKVFLLDEPLSNLDAKLRVTMRTEITKLHNSIGTTFIYVTHDQVEAMTMGTRIVVMKDGIIQQVDTPQNLYDNPINLFVATFIGTPQMNIFKAKLESDDNGLYCTFGDSRIAISHSKAQRLVNREYIGKDVLLGVRPEDMHYEQIFVSQNEATTIDATVEVAEKLGNETVLYLNVVGKEDFAIARVNARTVVESGSLIKLAIDANHIHLFDSDTELSILGVPSVNLIDKVVLSSGSQDELKLRLSDGSGLVLAGDTKSRLVGTTLDADKDVAIGITPANLALKGCVDGFDEDKYWEFEGTIEFAEHYPKYHALFVKVDFKDGFVVANVPLDCSYTAGTKVALCARKEHIGIFDAASSDKLLAKKPICDNKVDCSVVVKDSVARLTIGSKTKIKIPLVDKLAGKDKASIRIDSRGFVVDKAAIKDEIDRLIACVVEDIDVLGNTTVLYLAIDDIKLSAVIDGICTYSKNEKIKIAIKASAISVV